MEKVTPVLWKGKQERRAPIYLRLERRDRRQYFSLRIYLKVSYVNPKAQKMGAEHRRDFKKV